MGCPTGDKEFVELLQDNFLCQHVNEPTRKGNILDLVISNEISMVSDLNILEHSSKVIKSELLLKTDTSDELIYKYDFKGVIIIMQSKMSLEKLNGLQCSMVRAHFIIISY